MPQESHSVRPHRALRTSTRTAALLAAGLPLLLSPALNPAASAAPADDPKGESAERPPKPPTSMSTIGGTRLGAPGTQVQLKDGAPKLPKGISARSWIVTDAESGAVLASHNSHWRLAPASTLKMLFADTVLPKLPKDRKHTVAPADLAGMGDGSSLVGVKEGEEYAVHDLWLGVFLRSGNDAVHVLSAMNGGKASTVAQMNARARELRARDTTVVSPDGYDHQGQVSSAYDLTLFARAGLQNPEFREYAATASAKFPGEKKKGKKRESFEIRNTNRLLTGDLGLEPYPGIAGVKNGTTTKAGSTFTGVAQRGDRVLLVTVMHPEKDGPNRVYEETSKLLDWGFKVAGAPAAPGTGNTDKGTASDPSADGKGGGAKAKSRAEYRVQPVGRLVAPEGEGGAGDGKRAERPGSGDAQHAARSEKPAGGAGVALGVVLGSLVVLGGVAYAVHRRWPLPELVRRRR